MHSSCFLKDLIKCVLEKNIDIDTEKYFNILMGYWYCLSIFPHSVSISILQYKSDIDTHYFFSVSAKTLVVTPTRFNYLQSTRQCKRWCHEDLRVRVTTAPVLTHTLSIYKFLLLFSLQKWIMILRKARMRSRYLIGFPLDKENPWLTPN